MPISTEDAITNILRFVEEDGDDLSDNEFYDEDDLDELFGAAG